jgi:uncharacterized repeat protein (TIGR03803 family)
MSKLVNCRIRLLAGAMGHLAAAAAIVAGGVSPALAKGASYEVLYKFAGSPNDGAGPSGNLIKDKSGNLYSTTSSGGAGTNCSGSGSFNGCGTVFELAPDGAETVLYSLVESDGYDSVSGLLQDSAGNLYGECQFGGKKNGSGNGTVFKVAPDGAETTLYTFPSNKFQRGLYPVGGLITDGNGNLYGTANSGGNVDYGAVFKVAPDGTEALLYSFMSGNDGSYPHGGLLSVAGNFYGTTLAGGGQGNCTNYIGGGCGTVFELSKTGKGSYVEKVLYSFTGGADGAFPEAGLISDSAGNLYSTAYAGGSGNCGCGTVFKVAPDGTETTLYSFTGENGDGWAPAGSLIADRKGDLYGTTQLGGTGGYGVVFKVAPDGTETVLHSFAGGTSDGAYPQRGLIDDGGYLYGTATNGGNAACDGGCGIVFRIKK